ncbi:hypothetical protein D3OALGA1CA_1645 [Olavius algarvensis associated proteobacterium Delta 3]|nr:hypothetical protein D3OALGA1CA_1645 [Olavius algarvensis associated proteobacterium Delta 3]
MRFNGYLGNSPARPDPIRSSTSENSGYEFFYTCLRAADSADYPKEKKGISE